MRIIACVKAVPSSTEVKMDPKTNTIVRDGKQAVINPFDATALNVPCRRVKLWQTKAQTSP